MTLRGPAPGGAAGGRFPPGPGDAHHGKVDEPARRHCQHCWGGCDGECMLPGGRDGCIHRPATLPFRYRLRLLGSRRFWRRVWFGIH